MADSDNILSILAALGTPSPAPAPVNVLQAATMPQPAPVPAQPTIAPVAAPVEAPRRRRSLLDTIGQISDVLAKVGGAEALYQPTLDAREDRQIALADHARKVDADTIALETNKFDLADKHNTRLGQVARGLQAIQSAGGDINQAFPVLAQQMNLDPATVASVGQALKTDPSALDGLIEATTDPKYDQSKYGGSVVYGKDANGHLVAYQPSLGNDEARSILPDGVEPIDPAKFVDTGGSMVGVGTRTGNVQRILPKTAKPDTVLTTQTSRANNRDTNQTNITIAGMPARSTQAPGKGKNGTADMGEANSLLDNIERGFNDLHGMNALPGEGSAINQLTGALGRTALGQHIGEQTGSAAAQKRLEIEKDINSLQSEMVKSLPASATRTKFEQEIQRRRMPDPTRMSYATAQQVIRDLRAQFAQAQKDAAAEVGGKSGGRTPVKPRASSGGWSVIKVQ